MAVVGQGRAKREFSATLKHMAGGHGQRRCWRFFTSERLQKPPATNVMEKARIARRLEAVFDEQKKAATLASTATGFIMSICFFVLPLMWSGMFHIVPFPAQQTCSGDPWSGITDL
ncbi:unnamed protein product [Caenorhabditis auriculariae]|uniref:Uncharacterized protein n=1 Tax=Caenorhabditis auriculariae TaxID=2777116 RepID=A0A8S1H5E6_9PELO|nr:unnamed protein product [Caenorhabditis auriculariae]